ncbi:MAG: hypothetical protein JWM56_1315 [Candidatus Peribacteria bacterium]|nr:hypothetical protein [Candidatus Peribacteria bacterium]
MNNTNPSVSADNQSGMPVTAKNQQPLVIHPAAFIEHSPELRSWNYARGLVSMDLEPFPLVDDFEIRLHETENFGMHVAFSSSALGIISTFPWWDNVEMDIPAMTQETFPCGTLEKPYDDMEEGWQILIFAVEGFVYVLQGAEPGCTTFHTWYKVEKNRYFQAWEKVKERLLS